MDGLDFDPEGRRIVTAGVTDKFTVTAKDGFGNQLQEGGKKREEGGRKEGGRRQEGGRKERERREKGGRKEGRIVTAGVTDKFTVTAKNGFGNQLQEGGKQEEGERKEGGRRGRRGRN
jgi:hypothetical protein